MKHQYRELVKQYDRLGPYPKIKLAPLPEDTRRINDPINPSYYPVNSFDFIMDIVKDLSGQEAVCVKDVLKYVIRYKNKNGLEDLKKASWYLEKLIGIVENQKCDSGNCECLA